MIRASGYGRFLLREGIILFGLMGFLALQSSLAQDNPAAHPLPDDSAKAWAELQKVRQALRPSEDWQSHPPGPERVAEFQKQVGRDARTFASKAREFIARFPTNENVGDARLAVIYALTRAVAAGDPQAEGEISAFVAAVLGDHGIPEDNRVAVLLLAGDVPLMKTIGMRLFTEGRAAFYNEFDEAYVDSLHAAIRLFPTHSKLYTSMVAIAARSKGDRRKDLATEVVSTPNSSPANRILADHILKGTKPYQIGRPLDIRFTALDGREVDLAKLKGKVVLVEFWSTDCAPCIAGMPALKANYEKLHPRGFEVVAVSLDDQEAPLRRFIKEQQLPWPQHFDGKGFENQFALKYGVFTLPSIWLVDRRGNLRDTASEIDSHLERSIGTLLNDGNPTVLK